MSFPNPRTSPDFYERVKIGGRLIKASLVEIDGNKIEDEWDAQKPTGNSGATNVFKGTKPPGPVKLTFEITGESDADFAAEWDDLREIWDILAPKAGSATTSNGNTAGSAGSAAYGKQFMQTKDPSPKVNMSPEDLLKQAQQQLAAVQSGANVATPTGSSTSTATTSSAAPAPNPGPKPPTLSIENGYCAYVGITAISRKSWDGPRPTATNSQRVILEVVSQKEPTKAAVSAASPKAQDSPGQKQIAFGELGTDPVAAAKALNQKLAQAGAQWPGT